VLRAVSVAMRLTPCGRNNPKHAPGREADVAPPRPFRPDREASVPGVLAQSLLRPGNIFSVRSHELGPNVDGASLRRIPKK